MLRKKIKCEKCGRVFKSWYEYAKHQKRSSLMDKNDFDFEMSNGKKIFRHIPTGKQREEILKQFMDGKISKKDFENEQKKMRSGHYLKYLYSEKEYLNVTGGR